MMNAARATWDRLARRLLATALVIGLSAAGCSHGDAQTAIVSNDVRGMTYAVAPVLNFSGEMNFDPIKAADLLASELTYVDGINVLPVSRVVAYLAAQGRQQIESPAHALQVAEAVGADAIWIAGITEYDPYTPVVGLAIQVYSQQRSAGAGIDPVSAERMAQPMTLKLMADATLPREQIQMVYDGTHANVADAVHRFAGPRSENDSPLEWREYLKVQSLFLRFCWHDAIDRMMTQTRWREVAATPDKKRENPL